MRRLGLLAALAVPVFLAIAPAAFAYNDGRGFYGVTSDKTVTNAGFILIGFFPLFILLASLLQWQLEKRKERRKLAAKAHHSGAGVGSHAGW